MRTPDEVVEQVDALLAVSETSGDVNDVIMALRWVLGEEPTSPREYWADYLT